MEKNNRLFYSENSNEKSDFISDNNLINNYNFNFEKNINNNLEKNTFLNRGENINKKNKLSFKDCKKNTIKSLHEVEYFLNNINKAFKFINIYKFLK